MSKEPIEKISHKMLARKAAGWLKQHERCTIVAIELKTNAGEEPDALGFSSAGGFSALVECKTSRSDFHADKKKYYRRYPESGMGSKRFFMAPKGLLKKEEVGQWGLVEVSGRGKMMYARMVKDSDAFDPDKRKEISFLVSIVRRLEISSCVYVKGTDELDEDVAGPTFKGLA